MSTNFYDQYTSTHMLAEGNAEEMLAWSLRYLQRVILPHVPADRQSRILECGCGYGRNMKALRDAGYSRVTGLDISGEQVRYAKEKLGIEDVHEADAGLFLRDTKDTYDAVLILDVFEHLEVATAVEWLELIRSRLNPGGKIIIQVPNAMCPMNVYRYLDVTHFRSYTDRSMAQTLRLAGFSTMAFSAIPPLAVGVAGIVRNVIWRALLNPAIGLFIHFCHGSMPGRIFTGNLLAVVTRD